MTKKAYIFIVTALLLILNFGLVGAAILYKLNVSPSFYNVQSSYKADTVQQLTTDSDLVIIGTVTKQTSAVKIGGVDFTKTVITLESVLKGDYSPKGEISLFQTKQELRDNKSTLKAGDSVLLFLNQYASAGYTIKGAAQGHYIIKDGKVSSVTSDDTVLTRQIKKLSTRDAVEKFIQSSK